MYSLRWHTHTNVKRFVTRKQTLRLWFCCFMCRTHVLWNRCRTRACSCPAVFCYVSLAYHLGCMSANSRHLHAHSHAIYTWSILMNSEKNPRSIIRELWFCLRTMYVFMFMMMMMIHLWRDRDARLDHIFSCHIHPVSMHTHVSYLLLKAHVGMHC